MFGECEGEYKGSDTHDLDTGKASTSRMRKVVINGIEITS